MVNYHLLTGRIKQLPGNEATAKMLGYAGLIPFIIFSLGSWIPLPYVSDAIRILVAYAAVILSFMGAIHWGVALSRSARHRSKYYIASVLPALTAWLALLLPESYALLILLTAFIVLLAYDCAVMKPQGFPLWYIPLRIRLTIVVALCLLSTLFQNNPVVPEEAGQYAIEQDYLPSLV